ncbi:thiamine pyrophosphokinase [Paenibacillus pasadenensis]|uniref:Thiamine diphosphokinase n=1 Tax=Paenibacillus pasadenensis TaxID=217090 RepID=A0A2N5N698_9BACL|nr:MULTISPECIES: thiamine diphosphokinase [Paenibacillus]PLT45855.1 thiamine pyrophosphokinase [Paenibacillus pasadenensis]QGG56285.1 thiamine diphosphokinase [Paenibacillus sp. B01]
MPQQLQRVAIVTGGSLGPWTAGLLRPGDYIIGADAGALFLIRSGIRPDLSLGDFDSVQEDELAEIEAGSAELASFDPIDKNYTDTELALRRALDLDPASILIVGALGSRFDHSLANVHLLRLAAERGVETTIEDETNRIRLMRGGQSLHLQRSRFPHVSLLPLGETASGITLEGFRYPLREAELRIGQSLGISNALDGQTGRVSLRQGWLLVMETSG